MKVAIVGIYHESNTFLPKPTTLDDFKNGHLLKGDSIIEEYEKAHHELGGIIEVLKENDIEIIPLIYAEATPGGVITADTYDYLLNEVISSVQNVLPVDGIMVVPHGAGVSQKYRDMDGHWLSELRKLVGNDIPIIGTLDPHANVSQLMVNATNALVAYKTNPHVDQRAVGKEAAKIMVDTLAKRIIPKQVIRQFPLAISIEQQYTSAEPCKSLYQYVHNFLKEDGVISVSVILGFPYADVAEMGSAVIIVADSEEKANRIALNVEEYVLNRKHDFVGDKKSVEEVLAEIPQHEKPILMLDMGDNIGGGSPGNSLVLLKGLEELGNTRSFVAIYDPEAVKICAANSLGSTFQLTINGDGDTYETEVTLVNIVSGKFTESTPRHGGQVNYDMGKTAVVKTKNKSTIMLTSLRIPPFSLQQLLSAGVEPLMQDVIVAKGVNAPIAAYGPVCGSIVQVNTPGYTQADMTLFEHKYRRKPLFPFENIA